MNLANIFGIEQCTVAISFGKFPTKCTIVPNAWIALAPIISVLFFGKARFLGKATIGHLIEGEKTDWMVRIKIILKNSEHKYFEPFEPFDKFTQLEEDQDRPISELLEEFSELRTKNIKELKLLNISKDNLKQIGIHPEFGAVTLEHLLATWAVHDLNHIAQISRVMAKQYKLQVGPWREFLGILKK